VADSLSQAAADLYAMAPAEFTAARDELAKQARAAGKRDDAALIKKLTRPTVSAWLVNQLVRTAPEPTGRLYELAQALHAAQQELAGDKLRELSVQRRQVIAELMSEVSRIAAGAGVAASTGALDEVRATLEAALADAGARDAVRTGQLTRALSYAGIGEVDLAAALAVVPAARTRGGGSGSSAAPAGRPAGGSSSRQGPSGAGRDGASRDGSGSGRTGRAKDAASGAAERRATASGTAGSGTAGSGATGSGATGSRAAESAPAEKESGAKESAAERARRDLADAQAEVADAAQRLDEAEAQVAAVSEQRQFLSRRMAQLREDLAKAEDEGRALAKTARDAQRGRDAAARAVERAGRLLTQARQRVKKP
jgi:hypothetical protein